MTTESTEMPYALLVSLTGGKPARYQFNQDRVLVGRGLEADLRVEHAAFSRSQFLLERGRGSAGEPRYRITPYETTNPTYVNERPAVEGTVTPGDLIAIADVRVLFERKVPRGAKDGSSKDQIPPLRMVLMAAVTFMALYVGYLLFGGTEDPGAGDLATVQIKMFADVPEVRCGN